MAPMTSARLFPSINTIFRHLGGGHLALSGRATARQCRANGELRSTSTGFPSPSPRDRFPGGYGAASASASSFQHNVKRVGYVSWDLPLLEQGVPKQERFLPDHVSAAENRRCCARSARDLVLLRLDPAIPRVYL